MPTVILPPDTPTLLKHDGTEFSDPVAVQKLNIVYNRNYPEIIVFANNIRGFSEIGDSQDYIDSFTIETYSDGAAAGIKNAVGREATQGLFTLRVPNINATGADIYLIRFFECTFSREIPRRKGYPALHVAEITEIEVLDQDVE